MRSALSLVLLIAAGCGVAGAPPPGDPELGRLAIKNADPTVIRVGATYVSAESDGARLYVRKASSVSALASATRRLVWSNPDDLPDVWAPELVRDGATYYLYFSAGADRDHRMYYVRSQTADSGYAAAAELELPDDRWAIDGTMFVYLGQRYFVWSGWAGDSNGEQTLYLAEMASPTAVLGARFVISQPREPWEQADDAAPTRVNEGPEAIIDPAGQLHIVYSANGSWDVNYCLADLRLSDGGDPTFVWDWYKSNGCLFGANGDLMMDGWDPTLHAKGVGHHSFVLLDGDPDTSPPAGQRFPLAYHGVPIADDPAVFWDDRYWYAGTFQWWGDITYARGTDRDAGWSLKFFE